MKILLSLFLLASSFLPLTSPNGDAYCIKHKYKGTWKNNSIYVVINEAEFNNFLSYNGTLSGYSQYKNNVCPISGTFKLVSQGTYTVSFYESSDEKYCNASFDGTIKCYSDGTVFDGEIITPGEYSPKQEALEMTSVD